MTMTSSHHDTAASFDQSAAEKALHEPFVEDILLVAQGNKARTCECTTCNSWMPCNRHIPDFCRCPNCGAVH